MINFTELPERIYYPAKYRAKLSTIHSEIVDYVDKHFENRLTYKSKVISLINTITYLIITDNNLPEGWSIDNPFENIEFIEDSLCSNILGELYVNSRYINWDVKDTVQPKATLSWEDDEKSKSNKDKRAISGSSFKNLGAKIFEEESIKIEESKQATSFNKPTPKEDLYLAAPLVPRFDYNRPWIKGTVDGTQLAIYTSLPETPTTQRLISVTTDVDKMSVRDLMKLYPNTFIRTRAPIMYESVEGLKFHEKLGIILPIKGFTEKQVLNNIITYPHFYKLKKFVEGKFVNFYSTLEIEGELYRVLDIWETLPESKHIPKNVEFIKEYVVRRYLLERDIKGIKHKYPLYGSLDPFLTLFTTPDEYIKLGYKNVEDMARQCVISRVSYLQSRNPVIRRLRGNV